MALISSALFVPQLCAAHLASYLLVEHFHFGSFSQCVQIHGDFPFQVQPFTPILEALNFLHFFSKDIVYNIDYEKDYVLK